MINSHTVTISKIKDREGESDGDGSQQLSIYCMIAVALGKY